MSEMRRLMLIEESRKPRGHHRWLLVPLIILVVLLHWLLFQGQEHVPGVITRPLGPCDIAWFENKGGVLVLGCPHMDMLKLWPLPMEQPLWEDLPVRPGESVD
jgi:hypothetical protein